MEKFIEALANLEKSFSRFEELSDNYINNLSVLTQRKAQDAKARKQKMEFLKSLADKIDRVHRIIVKKQREDLH